MIAETMGGRMSSRIRIYNDAGCRTVQEGSVPDMGKYLNTGNAGFDSVKRSIYVDKTGMIAFINQTLGTSDKLT